MPDLPKIVIQRLQSAATPGVHPDPDQLNAFLENALRKKERSEILLHLASCADCREILVLATPESGSPIGVFQPRSTWLSWPVLRWVGAAACIVVVGAAVTLHQRETHQDLSTAQRLKPAATISNDAGAFSAAQSTDRANLKTAQPSAPSETFPPPVLQREARVGSSQSKPEPTDSLTDKTEKKESASDEPAERGQDLGAATVSVTSVAVPGRAKDEASPASANVAGAAGALMAKRATMPPSFSPAASPGNYQIMPRWTLTSDGVLQRSLDSGRTWEAISVFSKNTFRALASNGNDIWVGGANGALYHSMDAGQHWIAIQPSVNGEVLTSDIIGVEFTDTSHGQLTTAKGDFWITSDGGQSWSKR